MHGVDTHVVYFTAAASIHADRVSLFPHSAGRRGGGHVRMLYKLHSCTLEMNIIVEKLIVKVHA